MSAIRASSFPSSAKPLVSTWRKSCACFLLTAFPSAEFFHLYSDASP
eukprot:CAMPEP_0119326720 /NCGR_PEP_ID=MMETSP1333-20130426/69124_1 /TAXON_ID=418940 /ORGANISM="Scyphosphaera apsteinii, Strain RCC1455" /LENGTH=46 /DNA_ID= /DNA_START= /DNA_END= /DNA_ORIENTATION=